jgi:uncharacterized protein (DUF1330 family)
MQGDTAIVDLIAQLVAIHGEKGVCPRAADWRAIFAIGEGKPLHLLNLLKFKTEVEAPDGPITGAAAYAKYAAANAGPFERAGCQRIYFGRGGHMFAFGEAGPWDVAIVTRYPAAQALAKMWLDADFIAAHKNRADGVERSQVLVFRSE